MGRVRRALPCTQSDGRDRVRADTACARTGMFRAMDRGAAYDVVDALAAWSSWRPFDEAAGTAPRTPGVYLFRLPMTGEIVYVGMAGERKGGRAAQGLRGRLSIYGRGRGAVSGFGEAALDRALGNEGWLEGQLASLRSNGPKRAKVWAQEAIAFLAPEVRWAECASKSEALLLESQIEDLLGIHGLWNRASEKLRAVHAGSAGVVLGHGADDDEPDIQTAESLDVAVTNDLVTFSLEGHVVDLDLLYREMYRYSLLIDGERVFNGLSKDTPSVERLLNRLFDVPVTSRFHPVNNAIRSECRDRLQALGWATKEPGHSARYMLHRAL